MSPINQHNYEAFLLDYVEGNLSPEHTAELMLFLEAHPELKEELEDFDIIKLDDQGIQFDQKEELKIAEDRITPMMFDDAAIAEIEGLNTPEQSAALKEFIAANPEKQQELDLYKKTKLRPALVRFDGKEELIQEESKVIAMYWWYSAAAAVIIIIFLMNGIFTNDTIPSEIKVADDNSTEEVIPIENNLDNQNTFVAEQVEEEQVKEDDEESIIDEPESLKKENQQPTIIQPRIKKVIVREEEPQDDTKLAIQEPKEEVDDSTAIAEPLEDYLADEVKITFEDEVVEESAAEITTAEEGKKNTKFDVVRAAVKQQLKGFFGNTKKDLEVLTASAGEALSRKK